MLKVLLFSVLAFAAQEQTAHVHGSGRISIGVDNKKGKIELHVPGDTLFGFEHEAKSKKDLKAKSDALKKLEEKISEMIVFDPELKCETKLDLYEVVQEKSHSEVEAEFTVSCQKPVVGSSISFHFQKYFSRLKKVQVDVIADTVQKSILVLKNGDILDLK